MQIIQTQVVTVSLDELKTMMTSVVRKEIESLISNSYIGDDYKEELWDRKKAANFLGISEQTLVKLVLEEKLVAQKSGRKYHFLKSSIMNFLRNVAKQN
ncbi:MAG: helix-turn-helix domain-containing protein [Sediminibacterium sp.]